MQVSNNGIRAGILAIGMTLAASASLSAAASDSEIESREVAYIDNIVTVMRAHVSSMRDIIDNDDMKYADNMVRHAKAFDRAVGMVGPMDLHAAGALQKAEDDTTVEMTEAEFEALAEASHQRVEDIYRAANRYMRDKDGEHMSNAIDSMIASCGACHSRMPEGSVPSVWKGMAE